MPRNKVSGKVCAADANMYCQIGTVTTNQISYGPFGRKVNTKKSKLVKTARRCIRTNGEGKFINVQCSACTPKQACKCGKNSEQLAEEVQAAKVVIGPCPTGKNCTNNTCINNNCD